MTSPNYTQRIMVLLVSAYGAAAQGEDASFMDTQDEFDELLEDLTYKASPAELNAIPAEVWDALRTVAQLHGHDALVERLDNF